MTAQAGVFARKQVSLSDGNLDYWEAGQGRPVLYLHGSGGFHATPALERLAESCRVLAPVLPGFDGTPRMDHVRSMQDLARLAARFAVEMPGGRGKTAVIGHSFGGWVAAWLAVLHPEIADLLVLETPAGFRLHGRGGLGGDPEAIRRAMYAHPERAASTEKPPSVLQANRETARFYNRSVPLDEELLGRLGEIPIPALILAGTADRIIPAEGLRLVKARISDAHLVYVYDAAHMIETDQPDRWVRAVRDFLVHGDRFVIPRRDGTAT
jgi:pimeloyl-ACP methyl ester carboxylesterase